MILTDLFFYLNQILLTHKKVFYNFLFELIT